MNSFSAREQAADIFTQCSCSAGEAGEAGGGGEFIDVEAFVRVMGESLTYRIGPALDALTAHVRPGTARRSAAAH